MLFKDNFNVNGFIHIICVMRRLTMLRLLLKGYFKYS